MSSADSIVQLLIAYSINTGLLTRFVDRIIFISKHYFLIALPRSLCAVLALITVSDIDSEII